VRNRNVNINRKEHDGRSLDDLLVHAEDYATKHLRNGQQCPQTVFMQSLHGPMMLTSGEFNNERNTKEFLTAARMVCVANGATASVLVMEGWTQKAKGIELLNIANRPSESPDRQETLMLLGETRYESSQALLPILRSESGRFIGYGEGLKRESGRVEGGFASLLSVEFQSREEQAAAAETLQLAAKEMLGERGQVRGEDHGREIE